MIIHYKFRYIYLWIYYANLSFPVWIRPWFAHRKHICIILVLDTTDYVPPFDIFDTNMYSKHAIYPFIVIIPHWKGLSAKASPSSFSTRYFFRQNIWHSKMSKKRQLNKNFLGILWEKKYNVLLVTLYSLHSTCT